MSYIKLSFIKENYIHCNIMVLAKLPEIVQTISDNPYDYITNDETDWGFLDVSHLSQKNVEKAINLFIHHYRLDEKNPKLFFVADPKTKVRNPIADNLMMAAGSLPQEKIWGAIVLSKAGFFYQQSLPKEIKNQILKYVDIDWYEQHGFELKIPGVCGVFEMPYSTRKWLQDKILRRWDAYDQASEIHKTKELESNERLIAAADEMCMNHYKLSM